MTIGGGTKCKKYTKGKNEITSINYQTQWAPLEISTKIHGNEHPWVGLNEANEVVRLLDAYGTIYWIKYWWTGKYCSPLMGCWNIINSGTIKWNRSKFICVWNAVSGWIVRGREHKKVCDWDNGEDIFVRVKKRGRETNIE